MVCVARLQMISILPDGFRFPSLVSIAPAGSRHCCVQRSSLGDSEDICVKNVAFGFYHV